MALYGVFKESSIFGKEHFFSVSHEQSSVITTLTDR